VGWNKKSPKGEDTNETENDEAFRKDAERVDE
jgi:hypothetical protein